LRSASCKVLPRGLALNEDPALKKVCPIECGGVLLCHCKTKEVMGFVRNLLVFSVCIVFWRDAFATGFLRAETSGFLRNSVDRPNSVSTIAIGPQFQGQGKYLESKLDLQGIVQTSDRSTFTLEGANVYIATSKKWLGGHQLTLGRRTYDWSMMDDAWVLGVFSPRFIWDPTRPQKIGLTGAFYQFKNNNWSFTAYGSPLSIPERGFPIREENGQLRSSNPSYTPLYEFVRVADRVIPIKYNIKYPPMSDLLINPGGAMQLRYQQSQDRGMWFQTSYAYLPIHQVPLDVKTQGALNAQTMIANVDVFPKAVMHHMANIEVGFKANRYSLWASVTGEEPRKPNTPVDLLTVQTEPSLITSFGGSAQMFKFIGVSASMLYVSEKPAPPSGDGTLTVDLPSRFNYREAARAAIDIRTSDRFNTVLSNIYDFEYASGLYSVDFFYKNTKKHKEWTLNFGADFFSSATSDGFIGQYKGNDRVRGSIAYAF